MNKKEKYFSVMIISGGGMRQIQVPRILVTGSICLAAFIFLLLLDYGHLRLQETDRASLEEKLQFQELQLKFFEEEIESMGETVSRMENMEHRLRIMAGLEEEDASSPTMAMGPLEDGSDVSNFNNADGKRKFPNTREALAKLGDKTSSGEEKLHKLHSYFASQKTRLAATPSIWPSRGWVTSLFGPRTHPFTGLREMHKGIDMANRIGTPIRVPADGRVVKIYWDKGYGKILTINHGYGIKTRYAHCSEIVVKKGQRVKRGEIIAKIGNTGKSTGPHLHYEVMLHGVQVNPQKYILN